MPLDPAVVPLLDLLAAPGMPRLHELTPAAARDLSKGRPPLTSTPEPPVSAVERMAPGPDGAVPLRVYRPAVDDTLPLLVWFHGGGWVLGDLEGADPVCQQLAAKVSAVVVSVGYRLAPEHRFPAAVDDALAAARWAHSHADELGADPSRLVVGGDSAGGNLAAVVALRARDGGGPPIAFQLLVYPVTDLTCAQPSYVDNAEGYMLEAASMRWFIDHYVPDERLRRDPDASPLFAGDLAGLPPAHVVTAEYDPLRDEGEAYAERLAQAGVPVSCTRYDGVIHGFFAMDTVIPASRRAIDEAAAAIRRALGGS